MRRISLIILALCILGGLVAALFAPVLAATLTLPSRQPVHIQSTPTRATQPAPHPTAPTAQLPDGTVVLAHDTFQRPAQNLWGRASDNQVWGGDANTNPAFSIVNQVGQIAKAQGKLNAVTGVTMSDTEVLLTFAVNQFDPNGDINLGAVLRWKDTNNWYKVLLDGQNIQLLKNVQKKSTVLKTVPFQAHQGVFYSLRFRALGSALFAKAWPTSQQEPQDWSITLIDTSLTTGVDGIRVVVTPAAVISVTSFLETNVPYSM